MDFARFGLARRPFRLTPDTAAYCPTATHEAAASALDRALRGGAGAVVLDGEPGTGKTLVALRFLGTLSEHVRPVMVSVPKGVTPTAFFQAVLFDLGRPYQGLSEPELRLAVTGELLNAAEAEQRVVVFADEAHNLTADVVDELRQLGNVEAADGPALFLLLSGWPALRTVTASNPSFTQRIAGLCRLTPLSPEEAAKHLRHQIRECGGRPEWVFADEALSLLAELGGGIPRVLNRVAGLALELASADGADAVDVEAVLAAAELLDLAPPAAAEEAIEDQSQVHDEPDVLPHPNQVPRPTTKRPASKRKSA